MNTLHIAEQGSETHAFQPVVQKACSPAGVNERMAGDLKLLLSVILVPFAGLLVLALVCKLAFLFVSRRGKAIVSTTAVHEIEGSEGHIQRYHRISIRFDVDGRSYEADGFNEMVDYAVGSEVAIRYRVSDPKDVHVGYWSVLWILSVVTFLVVSVAWFVVTWHH